MAGVKICFRCAALGKLTLTLTRPAGGQTDNGVDGRTGGLTAFNLLLVACAVAPLQIVAFNRIW